MSCWLRLMAPASATCIMAGNPPVLGIEMPGGRGRLWSVPTVLPLVNTRKRIHLAEGDVLMYGGGVLARNLDLQTA